LNDAEVRGLLGMFSLDSLGTVAKALKESDSPAMLDVVLELERNGRSLQHFARELSRYMRNLLVKKIAPTHPRLVAASPQEQDRLKETSAWFSEEDLTRYLQITIDIFKDLQAALQPRLHLELGLLRMIHAGRLVSIEDALTSLGSSGSTSGAAVPRPVAPPPSRAMTAPVAAPPPPRPAPVSKPAAPPPPSSKPPASGDWRERLHGALNDAGLVSSADVLERSEVTASASDLTIVVSNKLEQLALDDAQAKKVLEQSSGKRIIVKVGKPAVSGPALQSSAPSNKPPTDDPAAQRAMDHPEVQRFRELFPEGNVRQVRDLKE
jgi:DNA polymerase-3 subunit gamma/tau